MSVWQQEVKERNSIHYECKCVCLCESMCLHVAHKVWSRESQGLAKDELCSLALYKGAVALRDS